jgi:hypothetical protein
MMEIFRDMLSEACSAIALLDESASQEAGLTGGHMALTGGYI